MIRYVNSAGCHVKFPSAYLGLLNWFVDCVETEKQSVVFVATDSNFLPQMLAAVERYYGKRPRLTSQTEEEQCADILRYICAAGGISELRIN
jgi:hypothetical protein